jgi:hypothetical protein
VGVESPSGVRRARNCRAQKALEERKPVSEA